jgi:hypothetical protein
VICRREPDDGGTIAAAGPITIGVGMVLTGGR